MKNIATLKKSLLTLFLVSIISFAEAQQPKLMLPIGHTGLIKSATYSNDGKLIVTASYDNTAMLWDVKSGMLITVLEGHKSSVFRAEFSQDDQMILTASMDTSVRLWDTKSGKMLLEVKEYNERLVTACISPDSRTILTASEQGKVKLWSIRTGKIVTEFKHTKNWLMSAVFNKVGDKILTTYANGTANVWDAKSGKQLTTLYGHSYWVVDGKFSHDGKKIVTASHDNTAKIWDSQTGKLILTLTGHSKEVDDVNFNSDGSRIITASRDNTAKVWDSQTGKLLFTINGHPHLLGNARFSPDGKTILTFSQQDKTATISDSQTGHLLHTFYGFNTGLECAEFSPDGQSVVLTSNTKIRILNVSDGKIVKTLGGRAQRPFSLSLNADGSKFITYSDTAIQIWDAKTGTLFAANTVHSDQITGAVFSDDGQTILTSSFDNTAILFDLHTGAIVKTFEGHKGWITSAGFSPNGKFIITASADRTSKIWDTQTGKVVLTLKGHNRTLISAYFSPDSRRVVTSSFDSTARVWDVQTGALLFTLSGHTGWVNEAIYSPDGTYILTYSTDHTAKLWDARTGVLLNTLQKHRGEVTFAGFSPDSKKIITTSSDQTAIIWETKSGMVLKMLAGHENKVTSAAFSPTDATCLTSSTDGTIILWNVQTGEAKVTLKGHNGSISSAVYAKDGKRIITSSNDYTSKVWEAATGNLLYTFIAVDSNDYLVVDKDFRYDGTPAARKKLYFTCGTEVVTLEQVKEQLYVPNLARRILRGDTIYGPTLHTINLCNRIPVVEDVVQTSSGYEWRIIPQQGGLGDVILSINGIEVKRYTTTDLTRQGNAWLLQIPRTFVHSFFVSNGNNQLMVRAMEAGNHLSSRGSISEEAPDAVNQTPPNLFAVFIGVSDYKGNGLDLKYAAKDADDLGRAFGMAAGKLLQDQNKEHVFVYRLTTSEKRTGFPDKVTIRKTFDEIGKIARPNDIVLVFFSGHGVMQAETKQFYFLTADASESTVSENFSTVGISATELTDWLQPIRIKAQKRILIFDACNSGQAINNFVQIGAYNQNYAAARNDTESQQIKTIEKLNEQTGFFILSAAASNQMAYELGRYSQGILTYALLKTMKQNPSVLGNGKYLDVSKWFMAAKELVVDIVKENNARQEPQLLTTNNFPIGIVDEEVRSSIILAEEKPAFSTSNLQNSSEEIAADDLSLGLLVDQQLMEKSGNGSDAPLVFLNSSEVAAAFTISGRYEIKDETITARINIRKGKIVKYRFEINGSTRNLKEFARKIADMAASMVGSL